MLTCDVAAMDEHLAIRELHLAMLCVGVTDNHEAHGAGGGCSLDDGQRRRTLHHVAEQRQHACAALGSLVVIAVLGSQVLQALAVAVEGRVGMACGEHIQPRLLLLSVLLELRLGLRLRLCGDRLLVRW